MTPSALMKKMATQLTSKPGSVPYPALVHVYDGEEILLGEGKPAFHLYIRNKNGVKALASFNKLFVLEAYIKGDLEVEGDLIKMMAYEEMLEDNNIWIKLWRHLQPLLMGRKKLNPKWIAKHYDSGNIQLMAADRDYNTYTPGIYAHDEDTLEAGAERKLEFAFNQLGLQSGDHLLEIGCGWGGMTRYCARRGVKVTGITLSKHQQAYCEQLIKDNNFDAKAIYQDFFTYRPDEKYDALSMMGVIEDLSEYPKVMRHLAPLIKPGSKVYLDFASDSMLYGTSSFITKYIWPGKFRLVNMTQFVEAVRDSQFEIDSIYNDRHNYYLWSKGVYDRWRENKEEIVKRSSVELWRIYEVLFASTAGIMIRPHYDWTAFRVVLEYPKDRINAIAGE
jgi:cyclopropane-fatty-acyl-phospholipid synthase